VQAIPPPPRRPEIIRPCGPIFFPFNGARITNEHKACLDEVALALQQDPRAAVVIDGHRDSSERVGISLTRANNARDYLVSDKGVDPARITVRNFGDTCPQEKGDPALNRRVEFWILPEGATIADVDAAKKCRPGSSPHEITNEQPAEPVQPSRPRRRRPGEPGDMEDGNTQTSTTVTARNDGPLSQATVVRSVTARRANGALRITVDADGVVQFKDFTLTEPARIVVDITGVHSSLGSKTIPAVGGLVDRVRVGEPAPGIMRIVVDLKAMTRYRVMRDGASLVIIVGEEGVAAAGSR